mmetsp:Transcript_19388/g.39359  ORF Transcript_19388/g.39359 Transcript_19388/m.39359 type:complete len:204 (-) Transcript_19388:301-912(-)
MKWGMRLVRYVKIDRNHCVGRFVQVSRCTRRTTIHVIVVKKCIWWQLLVRCNIRILSFGLSHVEILGQSRSLARRISSPTKRQGVYCGHCILHDNFFYDLFFERFLVRFRYIRQIFNIVQDLHCWTLDVVDRVFDGVFARFCVRFLHPHSFVRTARRIWQSSTIRSSSYCIRRSRVLILPSRIKQIRRWLGTLMENTRSLNLW